MSNGFLQIICRDHNKYDLGDILSAVPYVKVRKDAADTHCFARDRRTRRIARLNRQGLLPLDDVLVDYHEATHSLRLDRLSTHEARLTRLSDSQTIRIRSGEVFTDFEGTPARMDVSIYFRNRLRTWHEANARGRELFGTDHGRLRCYGGTTTFESSQMDAIWAAVESKLGIPEPADMVAEFSNLRRHLVIPVDDFDAAQRNQLVAPQLDGEGEILKRRGRTVNFRAALGLTQRQLDDVEDPREHVDLRRRAAYVRSNIVTVKT